MTTHRDTARALSDDALLARVASLAAHERGTIAELIAHLAEVDARKLHLASGYGSMFTYCRSVLRFSESEAYRRIEVARAARRYPVILDRLAEGAVNLTTVKLLAPHLTAENHVEALERARGRSKSEVEEIAARLAPAPDVPTSVRKMPTASAPTAASSLTALGPTALGPTAPGPMAPVTAPPGPAAAGLPAMEPPSSADAPAPTVGLASAQRAAVNASSPDRYRLQLTIDGETLELLRLAQDMSRHANPSGDEPRILKAALTLLVTQLAKTKFAASDRPRRSPQGTASDSRHVPAEVKRAVFVRDRGRCAFAGRGGRRCDERASLEFHHVRPCSEGGRPTVENMQLRRRRHNLYEWELRSTEVWRIEEEWLCRQMAARSHRRFAGAAGHAGPTDDGAAVRVAATARGRVRRFAVSHPPGSGSPVIRRASPLTSPRSTT